MFSLSHVEIFIKEQQSTTLFKRLELVAEDSFCSLGEGTSRRINSNAFLIPTEVTFQGDISKRIA